MLSSNPRFAGGKMRIVLFSQFHLIATFCAGCNLPQALPPAPSKGPLWGPLALALAFGHRSSSSDNICRREWDGSQQAEVQGLILDPGVSLCHGCLDLGRLSGQQWMRAIKSYAHGKAIAIHFRPRQKFVLRTQSPVGRPMFWPVRRTSKSHA